MRSRWVVAICLVAVALPTTLSGAAVPMRPIHIEQWMTLDSAAGVGRIEWSCEAAAARIRFVNGGPTTSRIRAFVGAVQLRITATLQPRDAVEMPFGQRVQRWRVRPISESLPEPVNFRIRPVGPPCARPVVLHDFG